MEGFRVSERTLGALLGLAAFILVEATGLQPWTWAGTVAWSVPSALAGVEIMFSGFPVLNAEAQYTYPLAIFLGWVFGYVVEYGILGLLVFFSFQRGGLGLRIFAICEIVYGVIASLLLDGVLWNPVLAPIFSIASGILAIYLPLRYKETSHV